MDYAKFVALLKKQSKNEKLSEQEQKAIQEWKKHDPEVSSQLDRIWQWSGGYETRYKPDTDQGLQRFRQRMAEEAQLRPAGKVIKLSWRWMAVAALLLGCVISLPLILQPELPLYQTAIGEIEEVNLPDGSVVVLNQGSSLQLNRAFVKGKNRSVTLEGEAFFNITSNPEDPFTIITSETTVEVLGTEFSLRAYPNEDSTVVAVNEGLVRFSDQKEEILLEANSRGACFHLSKVLEKKETGELPLPEWYLYRAQSFRGVPIQKLCDVLKERFQVELTYSADILSEDCALITFSIKQNEGLESLLQRLRLNLKMKKTGPNTYQILEILC